MSTLKESVQVQFGNAAEAYVRSPVHASGEDLARLVQEAALGGTERVLDAGCGAGHTAIAVAPFARSVVAVDLTEAMLEVAARLAAERGLTNLTVRHGDVEALPADDGEFDRVVSRYSAHHWPHPARALAEIRRALKPGGRFVLSDIVSWDDPTLDTWLQTIELLRDPSHVRDHSIAQWHGMLRDAGFTVRTAPEFAVRLDFADWVARIGTPADQVAALQSLFALAPAEVRDVMEIDAGNFFTIRGAVLTASLE